MDVAVIIPALNEEGAIGHVVRRVPSPPVSEIIVVDNGSTDGTADQACAAGARVVHEPERGYGRACLAGSRAAHAEILVYLDADGSFDPAQIPSLVEPIVAGQADLVLGSRELGGTERGALLPHQRWGNRLIVGLLRLLYGLRLTDLGPFRAIRADLLAELGMSEMTYGWPVEMMVKAARRGSRIVERPVSYGARLAGRSKVSGSVSGSLKAGYAITYTTLKHAWQDARADRRR